MTEDEKRLIEDYLPIEAISAAASSEPRTKGHIATLHNWRARRPLVACRAAVYGALVSQSQFAPEVGTASQKKGLGRANARNFVKALCQYPGVPTTIQQAQQQILKAHAQRLSVEDGKNVGVEDVVAGRAPRPRVLDMFAGGGAIPLEAARLGCESYAVELNPVAHIIELCTAAFPQQFGASLADEVERWGRKVLEQTEITVSDLFPRVSYTTKNGNEQILLTAESSSRTSDGNIAIIAYYWTRTVPCPNPTCRAIVPLYRQTWLRQKKSGYVALQAEPDHKRKVVQFRVVAASTEAGLGFDPTEGSENSSTVCPFCRSAVAGAYVRAYGEKTGFGQQLMCVIAFNPDGTGKIYIADQTLALGEAERQQAAEKRADKLEKEIGDSCLDEIIPPTGNAGLATGNSYLYGINTFRQMFTPRQRLTLLTMTGEIRRAYDSMLHEGVEPQRAKAIVTYLALVLSKATDRFSALARWHNGNESIEGMSSMKRFAMTWDFPEAFPFSSGPGSLQSALSSAVAVIRQTAQVSRPAICSRGSATELPFEDGFFDAVITDPPYYDNESYSELSDVFYVWLRPAIGFLYPEHFAGRLTPKKKECVAAAYRQGGKTEATKFYEETLFESLRQAHRVTKSGGILVMVYAHKTTLGWSTLVDAIRRAGYEVTEAWPLDTEQKSRVAHQGDAALASSIFLVARKREEARTGSYEQHVRGELANIVSERVETLWDLGISGADLVIASVGAGLRAFTRFGRIEYANGDEVPAARFLTEVETAVLETILGRLSKEVGSKGRGTSLAGLDAATRFYILWRYTYRSAELDAGEAIIFANGTHVELDGPHGLTNGPRALVEKKRGKYRLYDFTERGKNKDLGMPDDQQPAHLVDALHRTLWLMENRPLELADFLRKAQPNREQMRLVAQALAGPVLKGGELADLSPTGELAALAKLTANWRSVIEDTTVTATERDARSAGQGTLFGKGDNR